MPSFEQPPEWTVPIADLTAWFDWDALGAIGTVGALVFAIVLASRDSRDRRERNASVIMAVMQPIASVINVLENQWVEGLKLGHPPDVIFGRILATGLLQEMRLVLAEISVKDLPTAAAVDSFVAARSALENIAVEGKVHAENHPARLVAWLPQRCADLVRYHEALAGEALRFIPRRRLVSEMTRGAPVAGQPTS